MAASDIRRGKARARTAAALLLGLGLGLGLGAAILVPPAAFAGPPFRTDDPVPVDYRHGELYLFATGSQAKGTNAGVGPAIEANYGFAPQAMIHAILPIAYSREDGRTNWGYGDTEIGVKYRFLDGGPDGTGLMAGLFPLVELPTGDEHLGLGAGKTQVYVPLWLQKVFGRWTTYGGGGYWFNPGSGNKDYWFVGWLLQRQVTDQLALGGELFHQSADTVDGVDSTGFNLGGVYDFSSRHHLLFSAGEGIQNASETNTFSYYLGYQYTF
ncbi:MAG: transporter [Thiohalocapsa sp.]|jgi:hypothetical protein|uniref:hypothetical protein n=1 Tax=Thiohalocapsa sp. TaxID=2497641 RepID=UPI0025FE92B7|nr:hypothetical protein [Thiohalocapsa sp.]MCG6941662.1 transporter [Thiohalocapsa sp.]